MDRAAADRRRWARPPRPVPGEVARTALITHLVERFSTAVTTVVAGPGFGKSTLLSQAMRHNELAPLGIDAWLSCAPGFEHVDVLMAAMLAALGDTPSQQAPPVDQIIQAIIDRSPLDVCLIVDDCHLIPPGSSSERLLETVIRRLPTNGHLLLSGRWLPDVPLARLRAQDAVISLTDRDLAFDASEVEAAAERLGRDAGGLADLGGWPALVRLALAAGPGFDRQFLREEVLNNLRDDHRRALLALSLMGPSRPADLVEVIGVPVEPESLVNVVPLVTMDDGGHLRAHQLWEDALTTTVSADELSEIRHRAFEILFDGGELPQAAAIAIADADWVALGRCALELVRTTLTSLPLDTARAWLESAPSSAWCPALTMLDVARRHTENTRDPHLDEMLDTAIVTCRETGDVHGESTGIGLAALVAHGRGDLGRLVSLALRARELPDHDDAVLEMISLTLDAALHDLRGDPEATIEALDRIRWREVPELLSSTAHRLWVQAMCMAGRADETFDAVDRRLALVEEDHIRRTPALARWFAGDPTGFERGGISVVVEPSFNERDQFVGSCLTTVIMASAGSTEVIDQLWADGQIEELAFDNSRDSAHLTYMRAVRAVLARDEATAARCYTDHLAVHPVTDALGERHLRRWPALGVVLSPELESHWQPDAVGPCHARAVLCGRALLAARRGDDSGIDLAAPLLYTQLPLPWSVELACRWAAHDHAPAREAARELIRYLADRAPAKCTAELHHLRSRPDLAAAAALLLQQLPSVPYEALAIRVLGPLEVTRGGALVEAPELRRSRVRQLLMLVVVDRSVRRERVLDLLWPDMSPESAAGNLRVTLAHLRRLLEPDRGPRDSGYHLRADGSYISLHRSDRLSVDLWEFEDLATELADARSSSADYADLLNRMAGLWRGDPLEDLVDVGQTSLLIDRLRLRHMGTLLRLGELSIAVGDPHAALVCAERALDVDPYREQSHRLAIAAHLQLDDGGAVRRSLERLRIALDELGVEPDPATSILCRQAQTRFGV